MSTASSVGWPKPSLALKSTQFDVLQGLLGAVRYLQNAAGRVLVGRDDRPAGVDRVAGNIGGNAACGPRPEIRPHWLTTSGCTVPF